MSPKEKPTDRSSVLDWFGIRTAPDWTVSRLLGGSLFVAFVLLFLLALATAFGVLLHALFDLGLGIPRGGFGTGAVAVAVIGAPFVIWRAVVAQKTVEVQEQGHITDRLNKAVEMLGAEKTVKAKGTEHTEPNIEVRLGAIYALERIAQDSERDHIPVMKILCAYLRQNAQPVDIPLLEGKPTPDEWRKWALAGRDYPRLDVDEAVRAIERRTQDQRNIEKKADHLLSLKRAPMRKLILTRRDLSNFDLSYTEFQGAALSGTNLKGAVLAGTFLQGAWLNEARLQGAYLFSTKMQGALLFQARMHGSRFSRAVLHGAWLEEAKFHGSIIEDTELDGARDLASAELNGACLRRMNVSALPEIEQHYAQIFGDGTVTLPRDSSAGHGIWPNHWPKEKLNKNDFLKQWRVWQASLPDYDPDLWGVPENERP